MGKNIYLSKKQLLMINSALDTKILKLQEKYDEFHEQSDLDFMRDFRDLQEDKFSDKQ